MKQIDKDTLDNLIRLTKKYYNSGDTDILEARISRSKDLSADTKNAVDWLSFSDLIAAIFRIKGLCPNATNKKAYEILSLLEIEVTEAEQ